MSSDSVPEAEIDPKQPDLQKGDQQEELRGDAEVMRGRVVKVLVDRVGQENVSGKIKNNGTKYDEDKPEEHPLLIQDLENVPKKIKVDEQQQHYKVCLVAVHPQTSATVYHTGKSIENGADSNT